MGWSFDEDCGIGVLWIMLRVVDGSVFIQCMSDI